MMSSGRHPALVVLLAAIAGACTRYVPYRAAPLSVTDDAVRYRARRLDDAGLVRFLRGAGTAPAESGWTSRQLGLAALYYRDELAEGRALLAGARAGEITAGIGPAPSASASVERASRVDEGKSTPWSFSLTAGLTIETGGKRAARIAQARANTLGARLRLDAAAWAIAQEARESAVSLAAAERDLAGQVEETNALRALADLLRARYDEGQLSLAELARAEADVRAAAVQTTDAARTREMARLALARALAVPASALDSLTLASEDGASCGTLDSLGTAALESLALTTRADVGAALADFAAADAEVRLEVARQYPDITIGPGIAWDEGIRRWMLSLATPGIPRRARGPIAEAEARRAAQAARVRLTEDSVLAAVDSGAAACRGTHAERATADSLVAATARTLELTESAYRRGEVGRTEVAFARLALVRANRVRRAADARRATAAAALERALGRWLGGAPTRLPDPTIPTP